MRIDIPRFTLPEIAHIKALANFTDRENQLFNLRNQERTLEECAEIMNCSVSTINRLNKRMVSKIIKIM